MLLIYSLSQLASRENSLAIVVQEKAVRTELALSRKAPACGRGQQQLSNLARLPSQGCAFSSGYTVP